MELEDHVSDTAATASAHRIVRIQSGYKKVEIEIGHCTVDSPSPSVKFQHLPVFY